MRSLSNPEFSKLSKDPDGLMSCTDMQTYQSPFTKADLRKMNRTALDFYSEYNLTHYNFLY